LRKPEGGTKRKVGIFRTPKGAPRNHDGGVDVAGDAAKRDETLAGMVARTRGGREEERRDFEEERKTERMNPDRNRPGDGRLAESPTAKETEPEAMLLEPE